MSKKSLYQRYISKMESIKDPYFKNVNEDLYNGQNSYLRIRMKGSSVFNDEWILKIEDCVYELGQIVNNPLEVTKTEGDLTPIELARKINYESIQHLASHSQYVKDIDENGNVMPAKILAQFHKEELHTYENKFIATFIRRLVLFVEKRYDFIKNTVNFDTKDVMYVKNKSIVDGQEVTIETKVTLKKANEDALSAVGREFVKRVENMRRYVNYFYNSPFMKELKTEKNVRKPILQTNIIRKNPYYRKCYETFLFIEKFSSLGIEYTLDEKYQDFNENERKALNYILASNLLSLEATEESKVYKKSTKTYKPKLLPSCDDEIFTYGNLVKGPIEFVRVDEKYTEYLNAQLSTKIPPKPNKAEKEYFKDEIELKKNTKKHISEVDLLLRRIRRELTKWEKYVIQLLEERKIKEAKEAEQHLQELRKQEHDILERKRKEIIAAANEEKAEIKAEKLARIQKAEEERKAQEEAMRKAMEEAAAKAIEEVRRAEEEEEARRLAEEETARQAEEAQLEPQSEPEPEPAKEEPQEESVVEDAKIKEPILEEVKIEEQPAEKVISEQSATEEPRKKWGWGGARPGAGRPRKVKEAISELEPSNEQPIEQPVGGEPALVEEPVQEEPVVENQTSVEEPTPVVEVVPIEETQSEPQSEQEPELVVEESKVEEPVIEEEEPVQIKKSAGKTGNNEKPKAKKPTKKPAKKSVQKPESKAEKEKPADKEPTTVFAKIPGRFIVKSNRGYVVSKTEFSNIKSQARVFDDFNDARRYKAMFGGKVIKL